MRASAGGGGSGGGGWLGSLGRFEDDEPDDDDVIDASVCSEMTKHKISFTAVIFILAQLWPLARASTPQKLPKYLVFIEL